MKMQRRAGLRHAFGLALLVCGLVAAGGCTINISEDDSEDVRAALDRIDAEIDSLAAKVKDVTLDNREE